MIVGYARVSSQSQDLAIQVEALKAAGCEKLFKEKVSGAKVDRMELGKVLKALQPGDVLICHRLDRLARSTLQLLHLLNDLGERGIGFKSLCQPWCDTTSAMGRLVTTILSGFAEYEREIIRQRTTEGRERARSLGIKFGRKEKLNPYQKQVALERLARGESQASVGRLLGVDQTTVSRIWVQHSGTPAGA